MLKDSLLYGNTYCAIEYSVNEVGEELFIALLLLKKNGELEVKTKEKFKSPIELRDFLKKEKQKHLVLVINNQQVLFKTIEKNEKNPISVAFPTVNKKDFLSEVQHSAEKSFVGIVRKNYVESLVDFLKKDGIAVLDIVIGGLSVFGLLEVFPENDEVYTTNSKVTIHQNQISSIETRVFHDQTYGINGLELDNYQILNLGAIVNFYLNKQVQQSKEELEEFTHKTIFTKGLMAGLVLIFIVLLVNFMFFSKYYSKIERLQADLTEHSQTKEVLKKIAKDVDKKKKLLQQIQSSGTSSLSKYVDQLVSEIPRSVLLQEVNYQPFLTVIKEDKLIKNELKTLSVSGVFKDNAELSDWIDIIEKKQWVKKVDGLSIERDTRKKVSKFYFHIKID